jgi:hypothetical protein
LNRPTDRSRVTLRSIMKPRLTLPIAFLLVIAGGVTAAACSGPTDNQPPVVSVIVEPDSVELELGKVSQATAVVHSSTDSSLTVGIEWISRDTSIVTATTGGPTTTLVARAIGATWVVAMADELSDSLRVIVADSTSSTTHEGWQVTPSGSSSGRGTVSSPWSLDYALSGAGSTIQPGDTVWLRGGTYIGTFDATLCGTPARPIIVRQYPRERATIQGTMTIEGCDTWYWGFEVANVNAGTQNVIGVDDHGPRTKLINLIVHDHSGDGIGLWAEAPDAEAYGNIVYNNGFCGADGAPPNCTSFGHGIYSQNETGAKLLRDNIVFQSVGYGFHLYAESQFLHNFTLDGNVSFNNGTAQEGDNFLVGGSNPVTGLVFTRNMSYQNPVIGASGTWLGRVSAQNVDAVVQDNVLVSGAPVLRLWRWSSVTVTGNRLVDRPEFHSMLDQLGPSSGWTWSGNNVWGDSSQKEVTIDGVDYTWSGWRQLTGLGSSDTFTLGAPTDQWVYVRPNPYEAGRAEVAVYNWSGAGSVSVDLTGVLTPGQAFEVRNVQRIWDAPVLSGTYGGGSVSLPIQSLAAYQPLVPSVVNPLPNTGTEFAVFLVTSR